jgi:hypothetical protein
VQAEPELTMSAFFFLTLTVLMIACSPILLRTLWLRMKWEEYCMEHRRQRDRKEAEREEAREERGFE